MNLFVRISLMSKPVVMTPDSVITASSLLTVCHMDQNRNGALNGVEYNVHGDYTFLAFTAETLT